MTETNLETVMTEKKKSPDLLIRRATGADGSVFPPGSKSISNRALLLAALAEGTTSLYNLPSSDDVQVMLKNLPLLGVRTEGDVSSLTPEESSRTPVRIVGAGGVFPVDGASLNLDNAGTAVRPMTAVLAACHGHFVVDGNDQMRRRPIGDLVDALVRLGVEATCPTGCPPVTLQSKGLHGGKTTVGGGVSSQYLTGLLMAAPLAREGMEIHMEGDLVSKPYVDITIRMMKDFGVIVENQDYRVFRVKAGQKYISPGDYFIESDASSATYFLGAGALPGSGPVTVHGLPQNSIQGDANFAGVIEALGGTIQYGENSITATGPAAGTRLKALDIDMNAMPDAAMTLAVLALFCDGQTRIRNIENLRVKESERIQGLHSELVKLGASVEEYPDALFISPPEKARIASIETFHDHRMAMAFSLASFLTDLTIQDPDCVRKTFPGYFEAFLPIRKES